MIGERECEREESRALLRIGEHVSELESKLVIAVEKAGCLCDEPAPLILLRRHNSKNGLQPLTVELSLIAEVLEGKGEELALGHSRYTEVEPGPIVLIIGAHVRRCITRYPDVEAVAVPASLCLGHIAGAELAAKDDA